MAPWKQLIHGCVLIASVVLAACGGGGQGGAPAPEPPAITTQPQSQEVAAGHTATFTVTATGAAPLSYQWQRDGAAIGSATSSAYTTPAVTFADDGATFSVLVSNAAGSKQSISATLKVATAPVIATQPQQQTVTAGATATFSVAASGTAPLSYQWQRNGAAIAGATSASYTTPATTAADTGALFSVVVNNMAGSVTSNSVTLTVNPASSGGSYSTSFPLTESPIFEGGNWTNVVPTSWSAPVSTAGGHAVGLNSSAYNDSVAVLVGTYGRDQTITATAYRGGASGPAELELHLRMVMVPGPPNQIRTYEVDLVPSLGNVTIAKWDGVQGTYSNLASAPLTAVNDGDVFVASAVGPASNTTLTVQRNGVTILTFVDTAAFVAGNPGIGFDAGNPADGANLGWKSYSVITQ